MATAREIVSRHVVEDRHLLASLTREEKRGGPLVPFITGARFAHRLRSALALANVKLEAQEKETRAAFGVCDATLAALARSL